MVRYTPSLRNANVGITLYYYCYYWVLLFLLYFIVTTVIVITSAIVNFFLLWRVGTNDSSHFDIGGHVKC